MILLLVCTCGVAFGQKSSWRYPTGSRLPQAIAVEGRYLFIAQKAGGLLVLEEDETGRSVRKIAVMPKGRFRGLDAMNLVKKGNHLYMALGSFFGRSSKAGLAVVNVKNPRRPKLTSIWTSKMKIQGSAIVEVRGGYAYLGAMREGVYIFDVSNKRQIRELSLAKLDINFPKPNPNKVGHPNARGLTVRGNYMYVANDAGGLRVVDISDKRKPREISKYILKRSGLKQQAYNNVTLNYPYAYIALDYCGMEIVNIKNPRSVRHVGWWNPWRCHTRSNNWFNSRGHTNQIVLDKSSSRIYMSAGDSELQVIDVSNPRRPRLDSGFGRAKNGQGVWGLGMNENTVYLAYIRTFVPFRGSWSGIKAVPKKRP